MAQGAVVVFEITPDMTTVESGPGSFLAIRSIDFANGTYSRTVGGDGFTIMNMFGYGYNSVTLGAFKTMMSTSRLNSGALVNDELIFSGATFVPFSNTAIVDGTYYLGLKFEDGTDVRFGWLEFTVSDRPGNASANDITFTRFAFNNTLGEAAYAGQTGTPVPEASTFGFVGGLFGLAAAAHLRRRKAKQAAASDKFLALAAGEKLN